MSECFSGGEGVLIGVYDGVRESFEMGNCAGCHDVVWAGGAPPRAERLLQFRVLSVAPLAFLAISSIASVGILLSIVFLAFNLHFRKLK